MAFFSTSHILCFSDDGCHHPVQILQALGCATLLFLAACLLELSEDSLLLLKPDLTHTFLSRDRLCCGLLKG